MNRIALAALFCLSLGGCAWLASTFGGNDQATKTDLLNAYTGACDAYKATEHLAAVAIGADLLRPDQVEIVAKAQSIATPICTGPLPNNLATVAIQVLSATLEIANAVKGI